MAESKPKAQKVGTSIEVPAGAEVTRPDGTPYTIEGGIYVLDVPGKHVINGEKVTVK